MCLLRQMTKQVPTLPNTPVTKMSMYRTVIGTTVLRLSRIGPSDCDESASTNDSYAGAFEVDMASCSIDSSCLLIDRAKTRLDDGEDVYKVEEEED